ncbi:MAG: SHOCT domain-containing protein [Methanobacteriota archaeon]|nr:MAG: SHOCT domain-containing protein [Euryarchaeota archaeon]
MPNVLERLREKLEAGEITQEEYEQLLKGLEKIGALEDETAGENDPSEKVYDKIVVNGAKTIPGGVNKGSTHINGKLRSTGPLVTNSLNINGKADFEQGIEVKGDTKINGKANVIGKAVFLGATKISGKLEAKNNVVFGSEARISGKVSTQGEVVSGEILKIAGKMKAQSLSSTGKIIASGPIEIYEGIVAEEFISKAGGGQAKFIKGRRIVVGEEYSLRSYESKGKIKVDEINNFAELARYLTDVIATAVFRSRHYGEPRVFEIEETIEGEEIQLSYAHVKGDVIGDRIIIDENTQIEGVIRYRESVTLPENGNYETVQI